MDVHPPIPRTRLVVCVDGTWMNQDGVEGSYQGNPSNIYRIWASVTDGPVSTGGRVFHQKKKYFSGVGWSEEFVSKILNGVMGKDCRAQIKEVYKYCCENLAHSEDELFLFGFSRGAYVVRAVANLLHHMRILKIDPRSSMFDKSYDDSLTLYRSVRTGNMHQRAKIHHHFSTAVRPPPIIRFVGAFDTVKAVDDDYLYDISWTDSVLHLRHAMALNETRKAYALERCNVPLKRDVLEKGTCSLIEAWFLGSHADLGGANEKDGLSLYPLQWILSEAEAKGLNLSFIKLKHPMDLLDSPLDIVFPKDQETGKADVGHIFQMKNGVSMEVYDFRSVHRPAAFSSRYVIKLNQPLGAKVLFAPGNRAPFKGQKLLGYFEASPFGTVIHPSVYFVLDAYPTIYLNGKSWGFRNDLERFRDKIVTTEEDVFWDHNPMDTGSNLTAVRILVCGNAGVGKSTLLNRIFGLPMTEESTRKHGRHDIEHAFTSDSNPRLIIHDSCGFQAGDLNEVAKVQTFLRSRSRTPDITERLHAIWYCTSSTRPRGTETADELFFDTMFKCASEVPIVVVGTKIDEYVHLLEGEYVARARQKKTNGPSRGLDLNEMDAEVGRELTKREELIESEFREIKNARFHGPVFVSKDDPASILRLETVTLECLDNEYVRRLFVSAQICDVDQKIDSAITETMRLYRHSTRTSAVPLPFSGMAGTTVVSVFLCKSILQCFGYPNVDSSVLNQVLRNLIWSNMDANSLQLVSGTLLTLSEGVAVTGVGALIGLAGITVSWLGHLAAIPASARALLMCACDIILILERAFWYGDKIGPDQIRSAVEEYRNRYGKVHSAVKNVVPLTGFIKSFQFSKVKTGIEDVVQKHRFQREEGRSK